MVLDRASLKQESKALLKTARVNPYLFTLLVLAVTLVISGISNYMNMDDEFAYLYSVQYGIDLSFLALHRAFPALVVLFVSVVCALLNMVLEAGVSLYHLGIRRGEEMPYVTLFDGFSFAGKIILLSIVQYIFVFLWTLLFIVPGIVAAYRYRFAILNLGFKWQLFVLDLSFIGWGLLASLTLGILNIWLLPYMAQSNIAFFQEIKKAKGIGFFPPRPEDDGQFHPHDPFGEDNW